MVPDIFFKNILQCLDKGQPKLNKSSNLGGLGFAGFPSMMLTMKVEVLSKMILKNQYIFSKSKKMGN
jgi:hypothetical protein